MTDAERLLWSRLRGRRLGFKFRSQHSLGPFVADFVCLERKLIIEADGGQHNPEADRPRTDYLRRRGFRILRFWNHDILRNIDGVTETILLILARRDDPREERPASPTPASRGRGGARSEGGEGLFRLRGTDPHLPPLRGGPSSPVRTGEGEVGGAAASAIPFP
jgi:very-short-patch-repair endonuclease